MAEGGDENEDNPFSFKKFVVPKEAEQNKSEEDITPTQNGQVLDILPDIGDSSNKNRRKDRATLVISDDEKPVNASSSNQRPKKKKNGDANPFSFKKFLSGSSSSAGARPKTYNNTQNIGNSSPRVAPDFASDLPDFVQNHFSDHTHDLNLPDFAISSQPSNKAGLNSHNNEAPGDNIYSAESDNHVNSDPEPVAMVSGGTRLPDFLSDGILKNDCDHSDNRISTLEINGDYELELRRLREENSLLRTQLEEARREAVTESQRCHKMKKDMEDLQKKEAEENTALENMVQQIEANLTITTKRAVQAETTVSKLQSDVKGLQKQVSSLRSENDLLRSGDHGLAEIRERTKYSSEQLASAANTAEQSLKQLLQGVDQMKILAQVLSSIDKISEEPVEDQHTDGQNSKNKHKQNKKTDKDVT
ncbi:endosome-associated-trafficking regulator 1-like [Mytilus californianus]|uniref:endosome-associated-trafficking regulator 1-like n=1 Tax=Mytilus californianus TaxID=6549 RepID=UPI002245C522|nr:endosome-associated-trafficking regulator 1-like [Mytilus californianus]